jgi:hypothetical protein
MTAVVILIVLISLLWLIGQAVVIALLWGQQERSRTRVELLSRFVGIAPGLSAVSAAEKRPNRVDGDTPVPERRVPAPEPAAPRIRQQSAPENAETRGVETPRHPAELTFPAPVRRQSPVPPANQPLPPAGDPGSRPDRRTTDSRATIASGSSPLHSSQEATATLSVQEPSERPRAGLPPGSILPDFELHTIDGERFRRSQLGTKRIALIFLAPESPGSSAVLETIRSSHVPKRSLPDLILVIAGGTPEDSIRRWLGRLPKRVTVLMQEDAELATVLNVSGAPAAYLLDGGSQTHGPLRSGARDVLEGLGIAASQMTTSARRSTDITSHAQASQRSFSGLPVGSRMPAIRFPLLNGGEWERSSRCPTLLVLWDVACRRCDELRDALADELQQWRGFDTVVIVRGLQPGDRSLEPLAGIIPIVVQTGFDIARRLHLLEAPAAMAVSPEGEISRPPAIGVAAVLSLGRALHDQTARSEKVRTERAGS